jgi:transcriptional regulator with XRE-family HTH domain
VREPGCRDEWSKLEPGCQGEALDAPLTTDYNSYEVQSDISPAASETIGERLKRLRLDRGFSQRELAAPGVSYAYISRIEAGTRTPSVKALRRLAAKLGVSADYLETGSDLDPEAARELRLSNLELSVRLGEIEGVEPALRAALDEALGAGDRSAMLRARVSLASIALERDACDEAATLLEAAVAGEPFSAIDRFDIFANLGRAYAGSGRPERAVELFQQCIAAVEELGGDPSVEARYATLLSYALTDMGDIARAEEVVRHALERTKDTNDPYMRVRLYWSIARLAHAEGRDSVALTNVRKAIALLQTTDDTFHLARAHILAAGITLGRENADAAEDHLVLAENLLGTSTTPQDTLYITQSRARVALLRHEAEHAADLAREALELSRASVPAEEGIALHALADALAMSGDVTGADTAYGQAVELLEGGGRWRDASAACRAWGRLLRENGRETQALDVLDKAAELGMRATPEAAHLKN